MRPNDKHSFFHAEHDGDIYLHVQQLSRKLEGLLQPHASLFIPPPYPVLSQYIPFYEVRRNIKNYITLEGTNKCGPFKSMLITIHFTTKI